MCIDLLKLFQRRQTVATTRGMSKIVVNLQPKNGKSSLNSKSKGKKSGKYVECLLIGWLIDWLIDWLKLIIDWLMNDWFKNLMFNIV